LETDTTDLNAVGPESPTHIPPSKSLKFWSVVALTIGGLLSLFWFFGEQDFWRKERARWILAQADNAAMRGDLGDNQQTDLARELLEKAVELDPEIVSNPEYASLKLKFVRDALTLQEAQQMLSLVDERIRPALANRLSDFLLQRRQFSEAYQILSDGILLLKERPPELNNHLAYFAALAGEDLDEALIWINAAIADASVGERVASSAYYDTKAWVLYRLDRFEEALLAIDFAIQTEKEERKDLVLKSFEKVLINAFLEGRPPYVQKKTKSPKARPEVASGNLASIERLIQALATYRYHRAEILKSMGKSEEAEQEFDWLRQRGFDDFEKLY
jgi:tetratricopeptide (TPR) repeat protein